MNLSKKVCDLLTLLTNAGVTLKFKKCRFFGDTTDYLGHVIRPKRLKNSSHTARTICELQTLKSFTENRSFLGLCNVFQRFVPIIARTVAPLSRRLRKSQPAVPPPLNGTKLLLLETLKTVLLQTPVLALPDTNGHLNWMRLASKAA